MFPDARDSIFFSWEEDPGIYEPGTRTQARNATAYQALPRYGSPIASNELRREDIRRQRAQILAGAQEATTRVTAQSEPPSTAHADREREYSSSKQDDFSDERLTTLQHNTKTKRPNTATCHTKSRNCRTRTNRLHIRSFCNSMAQFHTFPPTRDDFGDI